jgi:hypothetical protein
MSFRPMSRRARCGAAIFTALLSLALAACGDEAGSVASPTAASLQTGTIVAIPRPMPVSGTSGSSGSNSNPSTHVGRPVTPVVPPVIPVVPPTTTVHQAPPSISGKPAATVVAGYKYQFEPTASDSAAGATLTFSVRNKPEWANFDISTGALSGTPAAANVGTYANIVVSVSDGKQSASLAAFTITVSQQAVASATLDWTPPTENTDGSVLSNLAGYNVYYGTSASNLSKSVHLGNAGLTAYTLTNLAPGTWYFAVTSVSSAGVESAHSGVVSASL